MCSLLFLVKIAKLEIFALLCEKTFVQKPLFCELSEL